MEVLLQPPLRITPVERTPVSHAVAQQALTSFLDDPHLLPNLIGANTAQSRALLTRLAEGLAMSKQPEEEVEEGPDETEEERKQRRKKEKKDKKKRKEMEAAQALPGKKRKTGK